MRITFAVFTLAMTCACASPGAEDGSLGDPNVRAKLRDLALQASSASGVSSPRTMVAVASPDHQAAEQVVSGDIVNDHVPVYVVMMTGGPFTATHASPPPGVATPQGNVLTLTVDAQTYRVTDVGVSADAPDLSQIDSEIVDLLAK